MLAGAAGFSLGAQNCHQELKGAYTGEVSASMLKSAGVDYVILGHSERREYFGETDALLANKVDRVLEEGLRPIFCCGESLPIREEGTHKRTFRPKLALRSFICPRSVFANRDRLRTHLGHWHRADCQSGAGSGDACGDPVVTCRTFRDGHSGPNAYPLWRKRQCRQCSEFVFPTGCRWRPGWRRFAQGRRVSPDYGRVLSQESRLSLLHKFHGGLDAP